MPPRNLRAALLLVIAFTLSLAADQRGPGKPRLVGPGKPGPYKVVGLGKPGPYAQSAAGAGLGRPVTALEIARRAQDRDTGRDSRATLRMKLHDRHGRVRERALTMQTLRGRGNPGAGSSAPDGDRLLIRFTYPTDIRGTSFLVWEHPNADDERFLYLPSLARVRRIAGAETQESFVGTDFTYEDIGGRELDEYTYSIVEENASWSGRPAWRLESRRKDASAEFPRVVSLILKDAFVVVQADIYNRRNEKQKVYSVRRLEQIEGIWTTLDSEMTNALEKTRTGLAIEMIDYNVGLKEADFSRRELERGISARPERSEQRRASAAKGAWRGAGDPAIQQ